MTRALSSPKPPWLKVALPSPQSFAHMNTILHANRVDTICQKARCPNIGECWNRGEAAFLILGPTCTRACAFCHVRKEEPTAVDAAEPQRLAHVVAQLKLNHVVITSVTRDDLVDGGAGQFVACIQQIRQQCDLVSIEVLVPDFWGKAQAVEQVVQAAPNVFNHNIETVASLFPVIRPFGNYQISLAVLRRVKQLDAALVTKSGMLLGLGESWDEIMATLIDLRQVGVEMLSLGQYLPPSLKHVPVQRFWTPDEFQSLQKAALAMGFLQVVGAPLARSSYHAYASVQQMQLVAAGK